MLHGFLSSSRRFIVISWRLLWWAQQGLTWNHLWGKLDFSHAFLKWPTYTSVLSKHILISRFQKAQVKGTCTCLCRWRFVLFFSLLSLDNFRAIVVFLFHWNFITSVKITCEVLNESTFIQAHLSSSRHCLFYFIFSHWPLAEAKINCLVGNANPEIQSSIGSKCAQRNFPTYWHLGGRYNPIWKDKSKSVPWNKAKWKACSLKQGTGLLETTDSDSGKTDIALDVHMAVSKLEKEPR